MSLRSINHLHRGLKSYAAPRLAIRRIIRGRADLSGAKVAPNRRSAAPRLAIRLLFLSAGVEGFEGGIVVVDGDVGDFSRIFAHFFYLTLQLEDSQIVGNPCIYAG